jgi:hypothetical protein
VVCDAGFRSRRAAEASVYGYSLIADLDQVIRYTTTGADYFLVDNSIDRYSVGDRTPGPTDPTERANWRPAPGDLRPALRVYARRQEVLDGHYEPPPFERAP